MRRIYSFLPLPIRAYSSRDLLKARMQSGSVTRKQLDVVGEKVAAVAPATGRFLQQSQIDEIIEGAQDRRVRYVQRINHIPCVDERPTETAESAHPFSSSDNRSFVFGPLGYVLHTCNHILDLLPSRPFSEPFGRSPILPHSHTLGPHRKIDGRGVDFDCTEF